MILIYLFSFLKINLRIKFSKFIDFCKRQSHDVGHLDCNFLKSVDFVDIHNSNRVPMPVYCTNSF